jgi:sugar phosphate isomerase/epimerase
MGLMIAVENHAGDLQATQLKTLIEEAGKDYVGALIDPGNATWTLEDPLHTLEILAPYCVTTGVRDSAIWEVPSGAASQWVAMGEGNVNIGRWAKRFTELCPGKPFSLEIINLRTPRVFNYRESEFWKDYRDVPAWIFAGFENLARSGVEYSNVPAGPAGAASDSPEFKQFMIDQERRDVEQAVQYAKDVLRIGAG